MHGSHRKGESAVKLHDFIADLGQEGRSREREAPAAAREPASTEPRVSRLRKNQVKAREVPRVWATNAFSDRHGPVAGHRNREPGRCASSGDKPPRGSYGWS
jgi:hypothetical protein